MTPLTVGVDVGSGPAFVVLHGYALRPATYARLANILAARCRVVIPDLFDIRGTWRCSKVVHAFAATLDQLGLDRVSLLGHSFGGGIEVDYASLFPYRIVELVFSDTLAVSQRWGLSEEALRHPDKIRHLATPAATTSFIQTWVEHPRQLLGAGWWGFTSGRVRSAKLVASEDIPSHVLWANRDSVLSRSDGRQFAADLNATFTVATDPNGRPIDHDWMFQEPQLFVDHLDTLGLKVLSS